MAAKPSKPAPPVRLILAADVKPEKLEFIWLDRIPKGSLTLLGGRPGEGKSLFTNYLAGEVTRAGGAVIMSSPEDNLTTIRIPRAIAAGVDQRLLHFWPGKLNLPADVEALEELVRFHKVELVTIDPIAKHIRSSDPNTALEPLVAMAERTGVAIVGVHHLNKRLPKDAHPRDAFGGANGGWLGTARVAHVLGPAAGGEEESRFLAPAKVNHGRDDGPSVEFYIEEVEVDLPDGDISETGRLVFVKDTSLVSGEAVVQYKGRGFKDCGDRGNDEKRQVATEFLTLLLMKGPQPAKAVFDKAAEVGVSQGTMKRAAAEMDVVKKRKGWGPGSYLVWSLPDTHPLAKGTLGAPDPAAKAKPVSGELIDGQMDVDDVIASILGAEGGEDDE